MAIAVGNAIVWKPSEKVPGAAMILARLLKEAGLPEGVFNIVHGDKVVVGGLGEAGEGAVVAVEDLAGEVDDALSADAGAQEDGDEDFVGDVFDAGVEGEFAGAAVAGEVADAREGDFVGARRFLQRGFHGGQHRTGRAA